MGRQSNTNHMISGNLWTLLDSHSAVTVGDGGDNTFQHGHPRSHCFSPRAFDPRLSCRRASTVGSLHCYEDLIWLGLGTRFHPHGSEEHFSAITSAMESQQGPMNPVPPHTAGPNKHGGEPSSLLSKGVVPECWGLAQ